MEERTDQIGSRKKRASQLRSMWEYASVVAFLDSFGSNLKIKSFHPWELEDALLGIPESPKREDAPVDGGQSNGRTTEHKPDSKDHHHDRTNGTANDERQLKKRRVGDKEEGEGSADAQPSVMEGGRADPTHNTENEPSADAPKDDMEEEEEGKKETAEEDDDDEEEERSEDEAEQGKRRKDEKNKKILNDPSYQYLSTLHTTLLKNIMGRGSSLLTTERWEGYLKRQLDQRWEEGLESLFGASNPLQGSEYASLPLHTKVLLLKFLCDLQLESNPTLLAEINELESRNEVDQLRPTPIGRDGRGRHYWYFGAGKRPYLYRETRPLLEDDRLSIINPGKWKMVCKTLAELEAFADDLIDNKNKHARKLATTIMHEVVPPLFAQELEEQKVVQRQARTRRAGIDTSNVINGLAATRSKRARKAVNYNYDEKELDKAIREYNSERNRAADDDESDGDEHQPTKGTRSSSRIADRQKRKRPGSE